MKIEATLGLLITLQLLTIESLLAQQALVRSYENPTLEIGQAYLSHYDSRCLAVLPMHVAEESGALAALLREGAAPLLGETTSVTNLGDDLAIADVTGAITNDCGYSTLSISRSVSSRIRSSALAAIRSVNSDGSIGQLSVTIIDDDGERFLRVQPTNDANQLRKGQSGSMLMSGDTPIGMLISVDSRFGIGKVIRLDAMFDKIDSAVSEILSSPPSSSTAADADAPQDANGRIVSWSALPIDAEHRAINLLATDGSPAWAAEVNQWPVEVEIELPGERTAISGIELDAINVTNADHLPATIEIMLSGTATGRRWRSVSGGTVTFSNGKAAIEIAPSWAKRIRVVISGTANGGNLLELGRMRVLKSD